MRDQAEAEQLCCPVQKNSCRHISSEFYIELQLFPLPYFPLLLHALSTDGREPHYGIYTQALKDFQNIETDVLQHITSLQLCKLPNKLLWEI